MSTIPEDLDLNEADLATRFSAVEAFDRRQDQLEQRRRALHEASLTEADRLRTIEQQNFFERVASDADPEASLIQDPFDGRDVSFPESFVDKFRLGLEFEARNADTPRPDEQDQRVTLFGGDGLALEATRAGPDAPLDFEVTGELREALQSRVGGIREGFTSTFQGLPTGRELGLPPGTTGVIDPRFVTGAAETIGDVIETPESVVRGTEFVLSTGANLPGIFPGTGTREQFIRAEMTGREIGWRAVETGEALAELARSDPRFLAGRLGTAAGIGLLGGRAIESVPRAIRGARVRAGAGGTVDIEDISPSETTGTGGVQLFRTDPDAPTPEAVSEVIRRAQDQPEEIQDILGSRAVLMRSESDPLPGSFAVQQGEFELPGLFTSPDLSRLRLRGEGPSDLASFRFPRLRGSGEQVSLFQGDRVAGMPSSARGSGFAVVDADGNIVARFPNTGQGAVAARRLAAQVGGQRIPDPTTSGARFLSERAETGTAFVRPPGSRTPELEAIFPPESRFVETGETIAIRAGGTEIPVPLTGRSVRVGGRTIEARAFRRADDDTDPAPTTDEPNVTGDDADAAVTDPDAVVVSELPEDRLGRPSGQPVEPASPTVTVSDPDAMVVSGTDADASVVSGEEVDRVTASDPDASVRSDPDADVTSPPSRPTEPSMTSPPSASPPSSAGTTTSGTTTTGPSTSPPPSSTPPSSSPPSTPSETSPGPPTSGPGPSPPPSTPGGSDTPPPNIPPPPPTSPGPGPDPIPDIPPPPPAPRREPPEFDDLFFEEETPGRFSFQRVTELPAPDELNEPPSMDPDTELESLNEPSFEKPDFKDP